MERRSRRTVNCRYKKSIEMTNHNDIATLFNTEFDASDPLSETLDPADWSHTEALLADAAGRISRRLRSIRDEPVWTAPTAATNALADELLPKNGEPLESVYKQFLESVWPHPTGNIHPKFWGWVHGTGTHAGILADLLMSGMNAHVSGFHQSATIVERVVLRWLRETMGFPNTASAALVSGGTVANLIGLLVARNSRCPTVKNRGFWGSAISAPAVYASELVHGWAEKSCDVLGLGTEALRLVEADRFGRIRLDQLDRAIAEDRASGRTPIAIIASAGTVSTGAVDDLLQLSKLARARKVWLHVDGAFGAMARLSPKDMNSVRGIDRADSLAFDLHKWGYMQFDVGCVLVRDGALHRNAMSLSGDYLESAEDGVGQSPTEFASFGLQLTRSFRALRVWMCLKTHGIEAIGRAIAANCAQARLLAMLVSSADELELMAPVTLNVVCFRFTSCDASPEECDAINRAIMIHLQTSGFAVLSNTRIGGRFVLRAAITNHRTVEDDIRSLVPEIIRVGKQIAAERLQNRQ